MEKIRKEIGDRVVHFRIIRPTWKDAKGHLQAPSDRYNCLFALGESGDWQHVLDDNRAERQFVDPDRALEAGEEFVRKHLGFKKK
jgi:hypothetical protein